MESATGSPKLRGAPAGSIMSRRAPNEGDALKFGIGALIGTSLTEADRPAAIGDTRVFDRK